MKERREAEAKGSRRKVRLARVDNRSALAIAKEKKGRKDVRSR